MGINRKIITKFVAFICGILITFGSLNWVKESSQIPEFASNPTKWEKQVNNQVDNIDQQASSIDINTIAEGLKKEPKKSQDYPPVKKTPAIFKEEPSVPPTNSQPKPVSNPPRAKSTITDRGSFQHVIDDADNQQILGIDISHHQSDRGEIEWDKVAKSKVDFAFVKISEGSTYKDPYSRTHVVGARNAGIAAGGYHYARPAEPIYEDAMAEVAHFINRLKISTDDYGDLPAVLDLEDPLFPGTNDLSTESMLQWAITFCEEFEKNTGHPIIIYTGNWFINSWNDFNNPNNPLLNYELWIADYYANRTPAGGWDSWLVWQFSDKGKIDGITGDVDLNISSKNLLSYCK